MKKHLYLIVGASGTGKDYITNKICEEFNKQKVISRTTRKPRFLGEDTHVFVTEQQADSEFDNAVAKTIYNGYRYYTTQEDIENSDFYLIDPNGVRSLSDRNSMTTIFIKSKWYKRAFYMRKRGDSIKSIIQRLWTDHKEFNGFKGDIEFKNSDKYYTYFKEKYKCNTEQ